MTDTQRSTTIPLPLDSRQTTASVQWLLEKPGDGDPPKYRKNNLDLFICGEEAFERIAADLKRAKASVDIICWGFDPAMELIRTRSVWPRGDTWGGLLREVADGKYNGGKPVQVRLLPWYDFLGNKGTDNMPGYRTLSRYESQRAFSEGVGLATLPAGSARHRQEPTEPKDMRETFNAAWYRDAEAGRIRNLTMRTRNGNAESVKDSLAKELAERGWGETVAMERMATDHQKTILIDYDHDGGADAVGYVMGLNSVTDYWDTPEHLFSDPRRGASWEGEGDDGPGLKPYQDYACRIRGEALVAVSQNFTDAWNHARGGGTALARTHDLQNPPIGLASKLGGGYQRAQIVRTQPEEKEKTIGRLYTQATSFARNYIYVENQYFQHTPWAEQLKANRARFVAAMREAGRSAADIPDLHVMVVIPTPERSQMVPRTYDTVRALGQADSMPNQDKKIEDELKKRAKWQEQWEAHCAKQKALGFAPSPYFTRPPALSSLAESARAAGDKAVISQQLDGLGLRTLVAGLWSFDDGWKRHQADELRNAEEWKDMPNEAQRYKTLKDKLAAGRYREIYIHSKLLLIDDAMFTLGSANLNLRSMAVDAEINIASDDPGLSTELRKRVWGMHTGGTLGGGDGRPAFIRETFYYWIALLRDNATAKLAGAPICGFLLPFQDGRTSSYRLG